MPSERPNPQDRFNGMDGEGDGVPARSAIEREDVGTATYAIRIRYIMELFDMGGNGGPAGF